MEEVKKLAVKIREAESALNDLLMQANYANIDVQLSLKVASTSEADNYKVVSVDNISLRL